MQNEEQTSGTKFTELSGNAEIRDAIIRSHDINFVSPSLRLQGTLEADLTKKQMESKLQAHLLTTDNIKDIAIPLQIHGAWHSPTIQVDATGLLMEIGKHQIGKKVEEKLKEKLFKDKKIGDLLHTLGR